MGTNNFTTKNPGDVISSADPNQYKEGLGADIVPRNTSGVPTDQAGDLGTETVRFKDARVRKVILGTIASGLTIEETAGEIVLKVGGATVATIGANGLDGAGIENSTITEAKMTTLRTLIKERFTANGTFTVPAGITTVIVHGAGGGGGGAGGTSGAGDGGNGGFGSQPQMRVVDVTPAAGIAVVIGAGGAGGDVVNNATGDDGSAGGNTTFGTYMTFPGAQGGLASTGGSTQAVPSETFTRRLAETAGGAGGDSAANGAAGASNEHAAGGAGGTSGGGGSSGGGGGGAGLEAGGVGGNGNNTGPSSGAAGGIGAGGGGGGGAGTAPNNSGGGGAGGTGFIDVYYVK